MHTDCHDEGDGSRATVPDVQEGLDLNLRRNAIQATTSASCSLIGGCLGPSLVTEGRIIAALFGAFVGLVIGTFVSGFILMMRRPGEISIQEARAKHEKIRRKQMSAILVLVLLVLVGPFVVSVFGHDDQPIAWLICFAWIMATVGACIYARGLAVESRRLEKAINDVDQQLNC